MECQSVLIALGVGWGPSYPFHPFHRPFTVISLTVGRAERDRGRDEARIERLEEGEEPEDAAAASAEPREGEAAAAPAEGGEFIVFFLLLLRKLCHTFSTYISTACRLPS